MGEKAAMNADQQRSRPRRFHITLSMVPAFFALIFLIASPASAQAPRVAAASPMATIARTHYDLGMQYYRSGLFLKATEEFQSAAAADTQFVEAHVMAARLLAKLNRSMDAIPYYRRASELDRKSAEYQIALGDIHWRLGDTVMARKSYQNALALKPNDPAILMSMAQIAMKSGQYSEASRLLENNPALAEDPAALAVRAYSEHRLGRLEDAAVLYRKIIDRVPDNGDARLNLGILEAARGNLVEAEQELQRAILLVDDKAQAYRCLGFVQFDRGHYGEAAENLRRAVSLNSSDILARFKLAAALSKIGRPSDAVAQLESIRSSAGNFREILPLLGQAYLDAGMPDKAKPELERAWREHPGDTEIMFALAAVHQRLGEHRAAVEIYEKLLNLVKNDPRPYRALADGYAALGNAVRALDYERIYRDVTSRDEVKSAVESERLVWQRRFEELREGADERIARAEADARRRIADQESSTDAKLREMEERTASTVAKIREEADSKVRTTEQFTRQQLDELRARSQQSMESEVERRAAKKIDDAVAAKMATMQVELAALKANLATAMATPASANAPLPAAASADTAIARVIQDVLPTPRPSLRGGDTMPAMPSAPAMSLVDVRKALAAAEMRAEVAEAAMRRMRVAAGDTSRENPEFTAMRQRITEAQKATDEARLKLAELSASIERERALREEAQASAERVKAQSDLAVREVRQLMSDMLVEVDRGLKEMGADSYALADKPVDRLRFFVKNVRTSADARVARSQYAAEARLAEVRVKSESEVSQIMRAAQMQVDRARVQSAEEIRRAQMAADSEALRQITQERERLAAEALAKRLALAEQLRINIEADAQVRFIEEKARIEATFEADRIRSQREYDQQLAKFEAEYQRRLEAAQLEAKRATEQVAALTRHDTTMLMRSEIYQKVVRENAMVREDLASSRRRLEELGRDKENLIRESDDLRREIANVQSRIGMLEAESRRYQGIAVLAEPLQRGVNINVASLEELQMLPGIGVQEARNVIWYRENVGQFRGVEELSKVPGLDAAKASAIRGLIKIR